MKRHLMLVELSWNRIWVHFIHLFHLIYYKFFFLKWDFIGHFLFEDCQDALETDMHFERKDIFDGICDKFMDSPDVKWDVFTKIESNSFTGKSKCIFQCF